MNLSSLGEFGLIDLLKKEFSFKNKDVVLGIGDDCAVVRTPNLKPQISKQPKTAKSKLLLITTDTLVENVHFKLAKNFPFEKLGEKALAVNISDIAAMGGIPTYAVISLAAPVNFKAEELLKLAKGISSLAKKHKISIVGGDTVRSTKELMITITMLGEVEEKYMLTRSGAKVGDAIMVTGKFGGPAKTKFDIRNSKVEIRLKEGRAIAKSGQATAMIDSSDGLVRSIQEICKASSVGARIETSRIPKAKGASLKQALYGGEEYELVFTGSPKLAKKVGAIVIGEIVTKEKGIFLDEQSNQVSEGFDHFK